MSLYSAIKEVQGEEEKIITNDDSVEKVQKEEPEKEAVADDKEEVKESGKKDEAKPAEGETKKASADSPPDNAAFAALRREKAAEKRRADALEEQLKLQPKKVEQEKAPAAVVTEPDANLDPEAHLRWELAQTRAQLKEVADWKAQQTYKEQQTSLRDNAVKAFQDYESAFSPTVADYKDVMDHGLAAISASIRTLNPMLKGEALNDAIQRQVLRLAGQAEASGHDPVEYLYHQAKSWGYQPKQEAVQEQKEEEKPKPDLKKIVDHKKKSATSLKAGGKNGNTPLSREAVLDKGFGLQDFAKLSPAQLRELEQMEA